jgi:hypothetical protein
MKKNITALVLFLICTIPALADEEYPHNPDSTDDVPIDQWLILLLFLGMIIGFYFLKRKYKTA